MVKRYNFEDLGYLVETSDGELVRYEDFAQLQAELKQEQLMRFDSDAHVNAAKEHIKKLQAELSRQILNSISEGKGNG